MSISPAANSRSSSSLRPWCSLILMPGCKSRRRLSTPGSTPEAATGRVPSAILPRPGLIIGAVHVLIHAPQFSEHAAGRLDEHQTRQRSGGHPLNAVRTAATAKCLRPRAASWWAPKLTDPQCGRGSQQAALGFHHIDGAKLMKAQALVEASTGGHRVRPILSVQA